ncbi:MAG: amidohydrolase family protein [Gemmatimonadales bacterium]
MNAFIQRTAVAGFAALALHGVAAAQTVAITGGTVFPVSGPKIEGGTVIITNGRITAVGRGVAVPAGAKIIDATGKWVTPGLIHANAGAGTGVAGLGGFGESNKQGDVNPSFNLTAGIDPESFTLPLARTGGVTTGIIAPNGSFLPGAVVAVDYAGDRADQMVIRGSVGQALDLGAGLRGAGGGSRAGGIARLKRLFAEAAEYDRRRLEYRRGATQSYSAPVEELEALLPAVRGLVPFYVTANRKMDIQNALRLAADHRLRIVIQGGVEAWKVAPELARAGVAVALEPNKDIPDFEGLGARLDNVTLLREAGVKTIIAQNDPGGERSLRYAAGNAVRNGTSWDDALKSMTLWPAEAFGLADYGSLAPGKVGNVVIWSGDPFEFSAAAETVLIRGVETSLRTREHELRDRYRTLPPPR